MTYAAKKYKGSLHREIRKKHDITVYSLEILIFCRKLLFHNVYNRESAVYNKNGGSPPFAL